MIIFSMSGEKEPIPITEILRRRQERLKREAPQVPVDPETPEINFILTPVYLMKNTFKLVREGLNWIRCGRSD